ncbi:MAG: hypothetical protein D6719_10330 [Candidatus Dadabacteria bacterium]|nr:MAG: hypothetical protein D6719_10330 [Candidatus Dadabacteria bacterium]
MNKLIGIVRKNSQQERGYTLLEYCAGAAIIAGILWVALSSLGNNVSNLLNNVGTWATERANGIQTGGNN